MWNFIRVTGVILFIIFLIGGFIFGILGFFGLSTEHVCRREGAIDHLQYHMSWPASCYLRSPSGQWILDTNYNIYQKAN